MENIDYLDKAYHRYIAKIALDRNEKSKILIVLNGATRNDLNLVLSEISHAVKKTIHAPRDSIKVDSSLEDAFGKVYGDRDVLFFDEADALFGGRTHVKDAHDKYANLEVAYLLKSIDRYDGTVIFASKQNKILNTLLASKINILINFPKFMTNVRKVIIKLTNKFHA